MKNRQILSILLSLLIMILLAGCSVVFEAGISGKVVTPSGNNKVAVSDVNVFAYTDQGLRDSDFAKFRDGSITRPSEGSGYVATTTTNANGEFVVNKIVWESKKSEYGKTADVSKLYLIFYHQDYYPAKSEATIISGSTNSNNVYVTLEGCKSYTTINLTVYDVTTGKAMATASTLEYWKDEESVHDTIALSGAASIPISFAKGSAVDVTFVLSSPGDGWRMCDKDGSLIESFTVEDVEEGSLRVSLYMKNYEFTLPAFSGDIDGSLSNLPNMDDVDNISVRLAYVDKNDTVCFFAESDSAEHRTYCTRNVVGNNVYFEHGLFSGIGYSDNYSIVINEENYPDIIDWDAYTGKELSVKLRLYFDFSTPKYYEFSYSPLRDASLGHIKDNLVAL